jgi:hypothetical protein
VGRHAEGSTDWKLRAEVLTYSRARGLFVGISLNGAVIHQDENATRELYGRMVPFRSMLTGSVPTPAGGEPFVGAVRKATGNDTSAASVSSKSKVPVNPPPTTPAPPAPAAPAATPAVVPANEAVPAATPTPPPGPSSEGTDILALLEITPTKTNPTGSTRTALASGSDTMALFAS